jgi:isocitrate dehydrogenase (NAD+)
MTAALRVTLIQGGGAGFDQAPAVKHILEAAGAKFDWDEHLAGLASLEAGGPALPKAILDSLRATGLGLKTKLLMPRDQRSGNFNVQFRRELNLFAAVRPVKSLVGLPARHRNVDVIVIRELTEDLACAIEHEIVPGAVQSLKVVTESACRRFFRFAFDWARKMNRKRVHCVHKANILKLADGLVLEVFRETARDYPELEPREVIVDNCCMQLVLRPQQFDVLAMGNLYGDLVSDLAAGVAGGISSTWGINIGDHLRVYEAFHGGRPDQVPPGRANVLPLLLAAIDLLRDSGQLQPAARIHQAIERMLEAGAVRTPDLGAIVQALV